MVRIASFLWFVLWVEAITLSYPLFEVCLLLNFVESIDPLCCPRHKLIYGISKNPASYGFNPSPFSRSDTRSFSDTVQHQRYFLQKVQCHGQGVHLK